METIRYSRNCDEITIYSFDQISSEGDLRNMVPLWDGYSDLSINEELAEEYWQDIFDEYCRLTDDNKMILYYDLIQDINKLKAKRIMMTNVIIIAQTVDNFKILSQYLKFIERVGYKIDITKGVDNELKRILKKVKFIDNIIRIKQSELNLLGSNEESSPLIQQVVTIENHLKREIDIRKMSVKKMDLHN